MDTYTLTTDEHDALQDGLLQLLIEFADGSIFPTSSARAVYSVLYVIRASFLGMMMRMSVCFANITTGF